jgi:hypothetical protein
LQETITRKTTAGCCYQITTKEKFSTNPYYAPGVISNIQLLAPVSGIINAKKGDTIRFKIGYTTLFSRPANQFKHLSQS